MSSVMECWKLGGFQPLDDLSWRVETDYDHIGWMTEVAISLKVDLGSDEQSL